jgi:hypothetical protein
VIIDKIALVDALAPQDERLVTKPIQRIADQLAFASFLPAALERVVS